MRHRDRERRIESLAAGQHGVVSRAQLQAAGLSASAVARRIRGGHLLRVHAGVYRVGPVATDRTVDMAAVLAGGPNAVLSHTSALRIWGLSRGHRPSPVHVCVSGSGRRGQPGIRFHRVRRLGADERAVVDGVPATSPGRTLVDVAGLLGAREIEMAVAIAERQRLITGDALADLPRRYRGRPGMAAVRAVIEATQHPHFTRSEAERRALVMVKTAGLPRPRTNVAFGPYELDLYWPEAGVAVEIDGRAYHSGDPRFEGDRRKDRWLRARGIQVVRVTWRDITTHSVATAVQIGQILALARAEKGRRG